MSFNKEIMETEKETVIQNILQTLYFIDSEIIYNDNIYKNFSVVKKMKLFDLALCISIIGYLSLKKNVNIIITNSQLPTNFNYIRDLNQLIKPFVELYDIHNMSDLNSFVKIYDDNLDINMLTIYYINAIVVCAILDEDLLLLESYITFLDNLTDSLKCDEKLNYMLHEIRQKKLNILCNNI